MYLMREEELNWGAMPLTAVFETADDPLVVVGAFREEPLRDLCNALGIEDLSADERFCDLEAMKANTTALRGILQQAFRRDTRDRWLADLGGGRLPVRSGPGPRGSAERSADDRERDDLGRWPGPCRG